MSIKTLYQQLLLDHNKNPRNFRVLEGFTHVAHGKNPLCGDDYYLFLKISDGKVQEITFQGAGCAISKSSASLLTQTLQGKTLENSTGIKDLFIEMLSNESCTEETKEALGKLRVFEGVKEFPVRVKCATLIWRTFEAALNSNKHKENIITTE